jgi:hypothetical protein
MSIQGESKEQKKPVSKLTEIFNWNKIMNSKVNHDTYKSEIRVYTTDEILYYAKIDDAVKHKDCIAICVSSMTVWRHDWFCKLTPNKIKTLTPKQIKKLCIRLGHYYTCSETNELVVDTKLLQEQNVWVKILPKNKDTDGDIRDDSDMDWPVYNFSDAIYEDEIYHDSIIAAKSLLQLS